MGRVDRHIKLLSWLRALFRVLILYIIGIILLLLVFTHYSKDLPSIEQLQKFDPELITRIYSSDGDVLDEFYTQRRVLVPLKKIPPAMIQAVISIEDSRFLTHWGVSVQDIFRALVKDVLTLSMQQGASTLTQQLARILYEKIGFEKTFSRKIKEFLTALQIERMYAKSEILEMYINSSYMGHGRYGIQSAAKRYFN
ncbi:MAG: transglycosylase domain-containing protein, partial [Candidatus Marinimicrobia bacterium]|nr:transglycosylase domain-containing protein [Candidatus Neomarinimicrobiota bacterium]